MVRCGTRDEQQQRAASVPGDSHWKRGEQPCAVDPPADVGHSRGPHLPPSLPLASFWVAHWMSAAGPEG